MNVFEARDAEWPVSTVVVSCDVSTVDETSLQIRNNKWSFQVNVTLAEVTIDLAELGGYKID